MVSVTVKRSFRLDSIDFVKPEDMREIGLLARERIVRRTRQGQGPNGALKPLSAGYAKQKAKALGTAKPDLTVSGNMLNDITVTEVSVTPEEARVRLGFVK